MTTDNPQRGRPSLLTPTMLKSICKSVRNGVSPAVVCRAKGISLRTYKNWRARGKKKPASIYGTFLHGIADARAIFEQEIIESIRTAAKDDVAHAKWLIERSAPERWGPHVAEIRELKTLLDQLQRRLTEMEAERDQ